MIRVELLPGPEAFYFVIATLLVPLGAWLALGSPAVESTRRRLGKRPLLALALLVGVVGAIYGVGGGSILAPVLVGFGFAVAEVAPAALAATFLTSIAGVITYALLSIGEGGENARFGSSACRSGSAACSAASPARRCRTGSPRDRCAARSASSP